MYADLKIASLDQATVEKIKVLEEEIGKHIMAFEPGVSFAQLSVDEVHKVESLEKETGVTLLVYNKLA
jgi:hypothetical protein